MNRPTPVPLFNYKKRQRQALVSDPGQVLPGSNSHADGPTSSNKSGGTPASISQNWPDKKHVPSSTASTRCSNPSSSNRPTPGLMDMAGKFSGSKKDINFSSRVQDNTMTSTHSSNTSGPSYNSSNPRPNWSFNNKGRGFSSSFGTRPIVEERSCTQGRGGYSRAGFNTSARGSRGGGSFSARGNIQSNSNQQRVISSTNTSSNRAGQQSSSYSTKPSIFKSSFASDKAASSSPALNMTANNLSNKSMPFSNVNYNSNRGRGPQSNRQRRPTQFAPDINKDDGFLRKRNQGSTSNFEEKNSIFDEQKTQSQSQPAQKGSYRKSVPDTSMRIFTCPIASLKSWMELKVNTGTVMFEVYGLLDSATVKDPTKTGKEFVLRDDTDSIKCVFYEIDRELPRLTRGQVHRVVGNLDPRRSLLKVVSVRPAQQEERAVCQAASALSHAEMERLAGVNNEQ